MIKDTNSTSRNIEKAYNENKYIVTRNVIYQPFYSVNAGYYAQPVYKTNEPMTLVGRFFHMTGKEVNRMLGFDHLNDL